jgi:hypothetical protein
MALVVWFRLTKSLLPVLEMVETLPKSKFQDNSQGSIFQKDIGPVC